MPDWVRPLKRFNVELGTARHFWSPVLLTSGPQAPPEQSVPPKLQQNDNDNELNAGGVSHVR